MHYNNNVTDSLIHKKCVPCEGGTKPLTRPEFEVYLPQVSDWQIINDLALQKEFVFKDFAEGVAFINKIANVAQEEGHHPDIKLHDYKKVTIILSTHAIGGLSINDFIMATKIDQLV
jgi:4a-hydroxytetrahydrobiopterin dehydratase